MSLAELRVVQGPFKFIYSRLNQPKCHVREIILALAIYIMNILILFPTAINKFNFPSPRGSSSSYQPSPRRWRIPWQDHRGQPANGWPTREDNID